MQHVSYHQHDISWIKYVTYWKEGKDGDHNVSNHGITRTSNYGSNYPSGSPPRGPNIQHNLCNNNIQPIFRRMWIWNWRLQPQWPITTMENPTIMAQETHTQPIRVTSIYNINLHDHPTTGSRFTHLSVHGQLQSTWLDAQGILWPSKCRITQ